MVRIARDAELRARLAEGAFARASEYALPDIAGQMLEHYERLVAEHRPRRRRRLSPRATTTAKATRAKTVRPKGARKPRTAQKQDRG